MDHQHSSRNSQCPHLLSSLTGLALACICTVSAQGGDDTWTGLGDGVSFHDLANWDTFTVPSFNSRAIFDIVGAPLVTFVAGPTTKIMSVNETMVGLNLSGFTYTVTDECIVGDLGGEFATLNLANGTLKILNVPLVFTDEMRIGRLAGSTGTVNINAGGVIDNLGSILVGDGGTGILNINAGGSMTSAKVMIGDDPLTSQGTVNIDGAGANWTISSLSVGNGNVGVVNIQNQGVLTSTSLFIGDNALSSGTINVTGTGLWQNAANCFIGNGGTGTVNLSGGGTGSCTGITKIGDNLSSSSGILNIDGIGSSWTHQSNMTVGNVGQGSVNITNGGAMTSGGLVFIGDFFGATGNLMLDGAGSTWNSQGVVSVGNSGTGTLTIQNGGAATISGLTKIGDNLGGADGSISVSGIGSSLTTLSEMFVGNFGSGSIDINGGGHATTTRMKVGDEAGSTGTLTVSGAGSSLSDSVEIFVGNFGTGSMNIDSGGVVSGIQGTIGDDPGSTGSVMVSGASSSWNNSLSLRIGDLGTGSLTVNGGASASAASVFMGFGFGSSGSLTVEDLGSTFTSNGNIEVGVFGQASLLVRDGGHIQINGGYQQRPAGSMNVVLGPSSVGAISVTGNAVLGGTLNISFVAGYTPIPGTEFDIITASSFTNAFSSITAPAGFNVIIEAGRIFLLTPGTPPIVGDLDGDSVITTNDLCLWHQLPVDIDENGLINDTDRLVIRNQITVAFPDCNTNDVPDSCETATPFNSISPLTPSGSTFGSPISVSGTAAIMGMPQDTTNGVNSGAAVIFRFDPLTSTWLQEATLIPIDAAPGKIFGNAVDIEGNIAIVGAVFDGEQGSNAGAAYLFRYDGLTWNQEAKLVASDGAADDHLGISVGISGFHAIVGAEADDDMGSSSGSAYVYRFNGNTWAESAKLVALDGQPNDFFAHSVAIDGSVAVVGSVFDDDLGVNSGSAYIYRNNGLSWTQEAKINAPDGAAGDAFGISVAVSSNVVISGSEGDDDSGSASGSAHAYRYNGVAWNHESKLTAPDGTAADFFGHYVALDGSVAVIGSPLDDDHGVSSGSASVFRYNGLSWGHVTKLSDNNGIASDQFGLVVSIDKNRVVCGAAALAGIKAIPFEIDDLGGNGIPDICEVNSCPADCAPDNGDGTYGDGVVQIMDLISLINNFGPLGGFGPCDMSPDNGDGTFGDGIVDINDLIVEINSFGLCP